MLLPELFFRHRDKDGSDVEANLKYKLSNASISKDDRDWAIKVVDWLERHGAWERTGVLDQALNR